MPAGSVRAIIALLLALSVVGLSVVGIESPPIADAFLVVVGFYFGSRTKPEG
jgi:hypothetical protein